MIVAKRAASPVATPPRVLERTRPAPADLGTSEAFVYALLDSPLTLEELGDITGMPEREIARIVAQLISLGIAGYSASK
jgi:hypothetical protein